MRSQHSSSSPLRSILKQRRPPNMSNRSLTTSRFLISTLQMLTNTPRAPSSRQSLLQGTLIRQVNTQRSMRLLPTLLPLIPRHLTCTRMDMDILQAQRNILHQQCIPHRKCILLQHTPRQKYTLLLQHILRLSTQRLQHTLRHMLHQYTRHQAYTHPSTSLLRHLLPLKLQRASTYR